MDIIIHSAKPVEETVVLTAVQINLLKQRFGDRFWFSTVTEATELSKEVVQEEFAFLETSTFLVRDNTKEFDGLDEVAKLLRSSIGKEFAIVTYSDSGNLFPKEDYI